MNNISYQFIIPLLLLAGCATSIPVYTMTDSQLQHEYLEKSSDLRWNESQLQKQRYKQPRARSGGGFWGGFSQSLQEDGGISALIIEAKIEGLKRRLAEIRLELSNRGLYTP